MQICVRGCVRIIEYACRWFQPCVCIVEYVYAPRAYIRVKSCFYNFNHFSHVLLFDSF